MLTPRMPVVFVGHGSPMNAIEDNAFHRSWRALARALPLPSAIVCISAHWQTQGVRVSSAAKPPTIHDFYGFPDELARFRYEAPGAPELAQRIADLLSEGTKSVPGRVQLDDTRGLDHGAWSVLCAMYPDASVPVVQLSLDVRATGEQHYAVAEKLAPLRDEGVLILGSGNLVHNLRLFNFNDSAPLSWAIEFDEEIKQLLRAGRHATLCDFSKLHHSHLAIPTSEHYLPLLYVIALQTSSDTLTIFNETVLSAISMTSLVLSESDLGPSSQAD